MADEQQSDLEEQVSNLKAKPLKSVSSDDLNTEVEGQPTVEDLLEHVLDETFGDEDFLNRAADVIDQNVDAGPLEAFDGRAIRFVLKGGAELIPDEL